MRKTRAENAGISLADCLLEMSNLYYNNRTKRLFFKGLIERLEERLEDVK